MDHNLHSRKIRPLFFFGEKVCRLIILLLIIGGTTSTAQVPVSQTGDSMTFVNGEVVDSSGSPIAAASVIEKGTTNGSYTNEKGIFTLKVSNKKAILTFSSVGYVSQDIPLKGRSYIKVKLRNSSTALNQVVVVGYGTQKKVSVTGAISTISMDEVKKFPTPSLSNAIAGKLPGIVSRQSSGEVGYDAAQIFIRGLGTWGNRSPLVLVDGIERDMNTINPQEIASFSILKDASATAVYGVRGANGVILIKTKHGKFGKPKITLRSETSVQIPLRLPNYIDGYDYAALMNEALKRVDKPLKWSTQELNYFRNGTKSYLYPNVNWIDSIFRKNTVQSINNLSVSGGNKIAKYFVNIGYTLQNGIFKTENLNKYNTNEQLNRYSFLSNVDLSLSKSLSIHLGLNGIIDDRNYPGAGGDAIFNAAKETSPIAFPMKNPDGTPGGISVYLGSNPWGMATQSGYSIDIHSTLRGTFSSTWDLSSLITKGLSISGKFAYDFFYYNKTLRSKVFEVKHYIGKDQSGQDKYNILREEQPLGYTIYQNSNRAIYKQLKLDYNRNFGEHGISAMLLANRRQYKEMTAGSSIMNLPYRHEGIAGRVAYNYNDKYLMEFDFGYNGSQNFPKEEKFGFFPSISGGWIISNEKFWPIKAINNLKIRGSYGKVGNDQIGGRRFLFLTTINKNAPGILFGKDQEYRDGMSEAQIGNPSVTWETAIKSDLGLDIEALRGKVELQVDMFWQHRENILMARQQIPDFAGFQDVSIQYANLGVVKNHGVDALLKIRNNTSFGLYYSFRGNFTYAHNMVIENDEPKPKYPYLSGKGLPIDQPWGLVAIGFFENDVEIKNSPKQIFQEEVRPGDIKYKDINHDNKIDAYDRQPIGYPRTPEIMYGFGGTVGYKGFDLSIYFVGASRTSLFLNGWSMYPFATGLGIFNVMHEYYDNRWTPQNKNAKYPAISDGDSPNNYRNSTMWQKNASYLRIKDIVIGYTVNKNLSDRIGLNSLRLFVTGTNLYTWDKVKVINPESDNGSGLYPLQLGVNFGVQIDF